MMVINHLQYTSEYYVLILFHGVSEISPEKDLLYFTGTQKCKISVSRFPCEGVGYFIMNEPVY